MNLMSLPPGMWRTKFGDSTIEWEVNEAGETCCRVCHQPEPVGFVRPNPGDEPRAHGCGHVASVSP